MYPESSHHVHYVSVIDGSRRGLLVGPFNTRQEAETYVPAARKAAEKIDCYAGFYAFGTCRGVARPGKAPPRGKLNAMLGLPADPRA